MSLVEHSLHTLRTNKSYNFWSMYCGTKYSLTEEQYSDVLSKNINKQLKCSIVPLLTDKTKLFFDIDVKIDIKNLKQQLDILLNHIYASPNIRSLLSKNVKEERWHLYYPEIIVNREQRKYIHSKFNTDDKEIFDNRLIRIGSGLRPDGFQALLRRDEKTITKNEYIQVDGVIDKRYFQDIYPFSDKELSELKIEIPRVPRPIKPPGNSPYLITSDKVIPCLEHLKMLLEKNEVSAARLIGKIEEGNIYYSDRTKMWTVWTESKKIWEHQYNTGSIASKIYDTLDPIYEKCIEYFCGVIESCEDDDEIKNLKKIFTSLKKKELIVKGCVLDRITKLSITSFMNNDFSDKLDVNPDNIPIKNNRVIELRTLEIRERNRDDFWSFEFEYDFLGKDLTNNIYDKEFMRIIFDNEDTYNFMRDLMGYMISYTEKEQILGIFTNDKGRNGKGIITQTCQDIFQPFIKDMCISLIVDDGRKINTEAEMNKLSKGRTALFQEPPADKKYKNDVIKKLTGGDGLMVRDCNQKGSDVKLLRKAAIPIIPMNGCLPNPKDLDPAVINRLCICFFTYYFRAKGEPDYDEDDSCCKLRDDTLKDRMMSNKDDIFTWWIVAAHNYNIRTTRLMEDYPEEFRNKFEQYLDENDHLKTFIDNCCSCYESEYISTKVFGDYFRHYLKNQIGLTHNQSKYGYSANTINKLMRAKGINTMSKTYKDEFFDLKNTCCFAQVSVNEDFRLYSEENQ
tara:strand:- start:3869 stop:6076 length:2208 start_codon:yes stop_codon:yes gene_type:complete